MEEKLATVHKLHDHVQPVCVLKGELEAHDERVIELFEDLSLDLDPGHLLLPYDLLLDHRLHGEHLVRVDVLHEVDFSIGATAYRPNYLKVALLHGRALRSGVFTHRLATTCKIGKNNRISDTQIDYKIMSFQFHFYF